MEEPHRDRIELLLKEAAADHVALVGRLPAKVASLPVDAQGLTRAIDHLAAAAGLSSSERRALVLPHATNPAILQARVFGLKDLTRETVIAAFVDGARVRADVLADLADIVGGEELGRQVRALLIAYPPPARADEDGALAALRATYTAHERAVVMIAASLDGDDSG
jgi:hypothetical protein